MSTPTWSAAGALPVTPLTVTEEVTAAPLSGICTSAVFSKTVPGSGGASVPRVQTAYAMESAPRSSATSLMFALVSQEAW